MGRHRILKVRDVDGRFVHLYLNDILSELVYLDDFKIYGISLNCIRAFRAEYERRAGILPITVTRIKETFQPDRPANTYRSKGEKDA